jgi:hypothetical protein
MVTFVLFGPAMVSLLVPPARISKAILMYADAQ